MDFFDSVGGRRAQKAELQDPPSSSLTPFDDTLTMSPRILCPLVALAVLILGTPQGVASAPALEPTDCALYDANKMLPTFSTFLRLGMDHVSASRPDDALPCLDLAEARMGENTVRELNFTVHYNRASAYNMKRDYPKAIEATKKAVVWREDYLEAYFALAHWFTQLGREEERREWLLRILDVMDANPNLAPVAKRVEAYAGITESYANAVFEPRPTTPLSEDERQERLSTARAYLEKALALDSGYGRGWFLLARIISRQGQLEVAVEMYKKAAEMGFSKCSSLWNAAVVLYQRLNRPHAAVEVGEMVIEDGVKTFYEVHDTMRRQRNEPLCSRQHGIVRDFLGSDKVETSVIEPGGERFVTLRRTLDAGDATLARTTEEVWYERTIYVAKLTNVGIFGPNWILADNCDLYADVHQTYLPHHLAWDMYKKLLKSDSPLPSVISHKVGIMVGQVSSNNYYHYMCEVLPRLVLLMQAPEIRALADSPSIGSVVMLIPGAAAGKFQEQFLEAILAGLARMGTPKPNKFAIELYTQHKAMYQFETLYYLDWRWPSSAPADVVPPTPIEFLGPRVGLVETRKALAPPDVPVAERTSVIYISRKDTSERSVLNEDAVADMLRERYGDDVVVFVGKGKSPQEQMETFARARIVIAVHGSAMVNIMFCGPGTHVIEYEAPDLHYFSYISGIFDLVFWALPSPFADAFQQDINIDIPELAQLLDHIDARPKEEL